MDKADLFYMLDGLLNAIENNVKEGDLYYLLLDFEDILDEKGFI